MKCGRPKWMLRQLFQVFFLSVLSILIVVAVIAYLIYFLPDNPHRGVTYSVSYQQNEGNQQHKGAGATVFGDRDRLPLSSEDGRGGGENHFEARDLYFIPLQTAPIRHVSRSIMYENKLQEKVKDWPFASRIGGGEYKKKCSMFTCFDIHRCKHGTYPASTNSSLSIYVYPVYQWVVNGRKIQNSLSREFYQFIQSIIRSPFYVSDPKRACVFVPSIDLLNLKKLSSEDILAVLSSLEHWGSAGQNHVLLSMFPGDSPLLHLKTNAIIVSSGLFIEQYRLGFHIPVISLSPLLFSSQSFKTRGDISNLHNGAINGGGYVYGGTSYRQQLSTSTRDPCCIAVAVLQGTFSFHDLLDSANANHDNAILLLDYCRTDSENIKNGKMETHRRNYSVRCTSSVRNRGMFSEQYEYPNILREFDFCVVFRDLASPVLWEVMSAGCIPVIIADHQRLPFDEFIDWRKNSIQLYEHQIQQMSSILSRVSDIHKKHLKAQVQVTFDKYLKDMNAVTGTLMMTLHTRIFSHYAQSIQEWNADSDENYKLLDSGNTTELYYTHSIESPLFNLITSSKDSFFTAVILAYERVASLFSVIQRLAQVPSLAKILVVWNNQFKDPPSLDAWPRVGVPVKIIQAKENKMSNRFFPYDEIETEAVFSLDDDIIMLTSDEMEFAFEAWREYPDRIVGFPSRSHVWDNSSHRWKYESEWTSKISMVLTGAAFYHKYWHYAYTCQLNRDIREWVDSKMNCEDIAMNFLVSARTGKPPIKVTPRKKFKCPTCNNNEMLSTDSGHMVERTDCINKFAQIMGFMPLIATEFRVDPVLFKVDKMPKSLKRYHDMGTL